MKTLPQRLDEKLAHVALPHLREIQNLNLCANDTLIICSGFEDRALGSLLLCLKSSDQFNILAVAYSPFLANNHDGKLRRIVEGHGGLRVSQYLYDRSNPSGCGTGLINTIGSRRGKLFIDVSGMSRLLIVQILVALRKSAWGFKECILLYSEAADYPPTRAEAEAVQRHSNQDPTFSALFLSSGVFEITVVPELSSVSASPIQSRLIVFPAFDVHHLTALHAELQPSRLTFIEGLPPNPANGWRKQAIAELNHLDSFAEAERFTTSTLFFQETLHVLLSLYQRHSLRERLLIAPTGSKMQAVAVGIMRSFVEDVQIVYSTPRGFVSPDNYTRGIGRTFSLDLGAFDAL